MFDNIYATRRARVAREGLAVLALLIKDWNFVAGVIDPSFARDLTSVIVGSGNLAIFDALLEVTTTCIVPSLALIRQHPAEFIIGINAMTETYERVRIHLKSRYKRDHGI